MIVPIAKPFLIVCLFCVLIDPSIIQRNVFEKQEPRDSKANPSDRRPDKSGEIQFKLIMMGNGVTDDGTHMDYFNYESSSGRRLYEMWIHFASSHEAEKKIQKLLTHAVKNLRESPEFDKSGKQVGKCVLVLLRRDGTPEGTEAILAWNNGSEYQEFRSGALEDVLAFETQHRSSAKPLDHE